MFLKEFSYMPKTDRRTFIVLCAIGLVLAILCGGMILSGDKSNAIDEGRYGEKGNVSERPSSKVRRNADIGEYEKQPEAKLFCFDPNTADSTQLLQLGLKPWQVRNIYRYRARGGVYQCKEDFAYVYGLTVKDYRRLEPYIHIGEEYRPASSLAEVQANRSVYGRKSKENTEENETQRHAYTPKIRIGEYVEVNEADTTELMKIPGIGSYYSKQIIRYRNQLGGFVAQEQLLEIEDFPEDATKYIRIDAAKIQKLCINQLTISQLKRHPYLNYYQARAISDYRRLHGKIQSMSELKLLKEFSSSDIERISPYIEY